MDLIDRLVEDGYLLRDLDHEFKLIRLTKQGAEASPDDLLPTTKQPERSRKFSTRPRIKETIRISRRRARQLLRRLQDWRRERALRDAVPAYVVAPNATLTEIAQRRPATPR